MLCVASLTSTTVCTLQVVAMARTQEVPPPYCLCKRLRVDVTGKSR